MKIEDNEQPWSKSPVEATPSLQETLMQRKMKEAPMAGAGGAMGDYWGKMPVPSDQERPMIDMGSPIGGYAGDFQERPIEGSQISKGISPLFAKLLR